MLIKEIPVLLCAGKLKMFPQKTLFKVCKLGSEGVTCAEKLICFFFLFVVKAIKKREEHPWSSCEKPSRVIQSVQLTEFGSVFLWVIVQTYQRCYRAQFCPVKLLSHR